MEHFRIETTSPLKEIYSIKHEPRSLDEVAGHKDEVNQLRSIVESGQVSHMLMGGPVGCGKLTLAKCFARELLGDELPVSLGIVHVANPLTAEEAARADRQSYVSTSRIGSMAGQKFIFPKFIQVRVKPFVELRALNRLQFKVLIVTDFHLLGANQQGFRRLMEMYGANCRFILLTSRISSVIDPIKSRCQVVLVKPVSKSMFYKEISRVGKIEGFEAKYTFINALYYVTKGNIGLALNYIQALELKGLENTDMDLFQLVKSLDTKLPVKFLEHCLNGKAGLAREAYYTYKKNSGGNFQSFLESLRYAALRLVPLMPEQKAAILDVVGEVDAFSSTSSSDDPHVMNLVYKIYHLSLSWAEEQAS